MFPEDFGSIQKVMIGLSVRLRTGLDFFYGLSFSEIVDIMEAVVELGKKQRIQNGHKDRR